jgi:hypothetical protein
MRETGSIGPPLPIHTNPGLAPGFLLRCEEGAGCLTRDSLRLLRRSAEQYLSAPGRFVNLKASPRYQSNRNPGPAPGFPFLGEERVRCGDVLLAQRDSSAKCARAIMVGAGPHYDFLKGLSANRREGA